MQTVTLNISTLTEMVDICICILLISLYIDSWHLANLVTRVYPLPAPRSESRDSGIEVGQMPLHSLLATFQLSISLIFDLFLSHCFG